MNWNELECFLPLAAAASSSSVLLDSFCFSRCSESSLYPALNMINRQTVSASTSSLHNIRDTYSTGSRAHSWPVLGITQATGWCSCHKLLPRVFGHDQPFRLLVQTSALSLTQRQLEVFRRRIRIMNGTVGPHWDTTIWIQWLWLAGYNVGVKQLEPLTCSCADYRAGCVFLHTINCKETKQPIIIVWKWWLDVLKAMFRTKY